MHIFIKSILKLWQDPQISKAERSSDEGGRFYCDEVSTAALDLDWFALMKKAKPAAIFFIWCFFVFALFLSFSREVNLLCWLTFQIKWQRTFSHRDLDGNTGKKKNHFNVFFFYCLWWLPHGWRICLKHERGDKGAKKSKRSNLCDFLLCLFF